MITWRPRPMRQWLAEAENTDKVYAISKQVVESLEPYELIFFDELFPQYVELAQKGKVKTAKQAAKEFSFSSDEVLLTFIILQALIRVFELLLKRDQSNNLATLPQIDAQTLQKLIDDALKQERQTYATRQRVREPLALAIVEELGDVYTLYENGLEQLLKQLGQGNPRYVEALGYQQQLRENISLTRRNGNTNERQAGRSQIIEQLNRLALSTVGISFNELCKKEE